MIYSIDRIIDNIAICEDENGKQEKINISQFPFSVYEGLMFSKENDSYIHEKEKEEAKRENLSERMERLFGEK